MAGLSQVTERIRLGQMVTCAAVPQPGLPGQGHVDHRRHVGRTARLGHRRRAGTSTSSGPTATGSLRPRTASASSGRPSRSSSRCGPSPTRPTTGRHFQVSGRPVRSQAAPAAAPADLDRRRGRAAHAAGRRPPRRRQQLRRQAPRVGPQARDPEGALPGGRPRRGRDRQDVVPRGPGPRGRGRDRGHRVPLGLGRAVRVVAGRQPGRHAGAGGREDPALRRSGLHRFRAVVLRLSRHRRRSSSSPGRSSPSSGEGHTQTRRRTRRSAARDASRMACRPRAAT